MLEFQKGNVASFEALMRKYYKRVLNFAYRFVGNSEVAEDLAQEVFIRVYKSVSSYKPQAKVQTWIFTITKNLSLNELRRKKRHMVSIDETFVAKDNDIKKQFEDKNANTPRQDAENKELAQVVREAIHSLPEKQRIAVILRRYEGFSYGQIAETINCSEKAVKSLLSRAKEGLKVRLESCIKHGNL